MGRTAALLLSALLPRSALGVHYQDQKSAEAVQVEPSENRTAQEAVASSDDERPPDIVVSHDCPTTAFLAGGYMFEGRTATGAPFFKKQSGEKMFLFYEPSCDGNTTTARWVLNDVAPDTERVSDLDADKKCLFWAYMLATGKDAPLGTNNWRLVCDDSESSTASTFVSRPVTLKDHLETESPAPSTWNPLAPLAKKMKQKAASAAQSKLKAAPTQNYVKYISTHRDTIWFAYHGKTKTGAPMYASVTQPGTSYPVTTQYLYFDPSCDGTTTQARWIISEVQPNMASRWYDLDGDGKCEYLDYIASVTPFSPPFGVQTWETDCIFEGGCKSENVTLENTMQWKAPPDAPEEIGAWALPDEVLPIIGLAFVSLLGGMVRASLA